MGKRKKLPSGCALIVSSLFSVALVALPGCQGTALPIPPADSTDDGTRNDDRDDAQLIADGDAGDLAENYQIVARLLEVGSSGLPGEWGFFIERTDALALPRYRFVWDFGVNDGEVYEGAEQSFTFPVGGVYSVSVSAVRPNDTVAFVLSLEIEIPPSPGQTPIANAGPSLTLDAGESFCLDGSRSVDPTEAGLNFAWRQIAGPAVSIQSTDDPAVVCAVAPSVSSSQQFVFALEVSNAEGSDEDTVVINVTPALGAAAELEVVAGDDLQIQEGQTVTLDGSASIIPNPDTTTLVWTQTQGPGVSLNTPNELTTTFVAPQVSGTSQILVFTLTATDNDVSASDEIWVTVFDNGDSQDGGGGGGGAGGGSGGSTDLCPSDPNKTAPGACGCGVPDTDSDGDGVADCIDDCPNDPDKVDPGVCGCGVSDADVDQDGTPDCIDNCFDGPDTDGDGVLDCEDGCPNDPNKTSPGMCGCGVSDADSDGDGVPDCQDGCPNDPNKTAPGICGCGESDVDTDGDGTPDCFEDCIGGPDSDGDGMLDCEDGCPNDPNKIEPGACGCGVADTDSDGDGVPNCLDGCPNDPNKTSPGTCGCGTPDIDSDGDGAPNCIDGCPNDPNKTNPGVCGCGTPDTDSDGDGVANCNDGCPNDPNKTSPGACGCGVPDTDSDGDGVPNCNDGCPNDPNKTAPGVCGCGVPDTDSDGNGTPDCIDVPDPAALCTSTTSLDFGFSSSSLTFEVWNCGGGSLNYSVTDNAGWLSVSPSSGSSSGEHDTLTATINRNGLSPGLNQASITVNPSVGTAIVIAVTASVASGQTMSTAHRTSGPAPLYVAFDATPSGSGVVQPAGGDYHSQHYTWDFGDTSAGEWYNNRPRNSATGFVTGHVFENPGEYTVTLNVRKADGNTEQYTQPISVQAFSGTTYYVAANGSDGNNGTAQGTPFRTVTKAATVASANVRILLRRGDTFTLTGDWVIDRPGPCEVGAYGSGADPVVQWASSHSGSGLIFAGNNQGNDWRFVNVHFRGPGQGTGYGLLQFGRMENNLFLNCKFTHWQYGVTMREVSTSTLATACAFVACEFSNNSGRAGWFGGVKLGLLGNRMISNQQVRVFHASRSVIAHNDMQGGQNASNGNTFKCHGQEWLNPVQYLVISDNNFGGNDGGAWPVEVAPQSGADHANEPMLDIVIERNTFRGNSTTQVGMILAARRVVVRNNLFIATGCAPWYDAIVIFRRSLPPPPDNVRVYNNTTYRGDSATTITFCNISADSSNTHVMNNALCAPSTTTRNMLSGSGSGLVYDVNFNKIVNASAFTSASGGNFTPSSGSPILNLGQTLSRVKDDMMSTDRPQQGAFDIGAVERVGP